MEPAQSQMMLLLSEKTITFLIIMERRQQSDWGEGAESQRSDPD